MSIQNALKLDKRLKFKNKIDGSKVIFRQSPFSAIKEHTILDLKCQFIGSGKWIRDRLIRTDTQRHNIIGSVIEENYKLRNRPNDDRATREIAEMFESGGDTFVN